MLPQDIVGTPWHNECIWRMAYQHSPAFYISTSPYFPLSVPYFPVPIPRVEGDGGTVQKNRWTEMGAPTNLLPEVATAVSVRDETKIIVIVIISISSGDGI